MEKVICPYCNSGAEREMKKKVIEGYMLKKSQTEDLILIENQSDHYYSFFRTLWTEKMFKNDYKKIRITIQEVEENDK